MTLKFNGITLDNSTDVQYNGTSIDKLQLDGVTVWEIPVSYRGVTLIGNLTNTDGILSGFSSNNYAKLPAPFKPTINGGIPFEFQLKFTTDIITENQTLFQEYHPYGQTLVGGQNWIIISYNKFDNNFFSQVKAVRPNTNVSNPVFNIATTGTIGLDPYSTYWYRLCYDGYITMSLYLQKTRITSTSTPIYTETYSYLNLGSTVYNFNQVTIYNLGIYEDETHYYTEFVNPFLGTIDLNECYFKTGNSYFWKGV